jgi:gluconate 5-dehydrogenase
MSGESGDRLYDVIVVGAGPAGLLVADQLEQGGHRVLLIEAGPTRYVPPGGQSSSDPVVEAESRLARANAPRVDFGRIDPAWRFRALGAECWWPRAMAVGGRANLWGGWLSRFGPEVFQEGGWPYGARVLAPYYRVAEQWLGATTEALDPRFKRAGRALGVRVCGRVSARAPNGQHWQGLHVGAAERARTSVVALRVEPGRDTTALHVLSGAGRETLTARAVVLAASPVETTRLLLESGVRHPQLGRRLTDHFGLSYVLFEPSRPCGEDMSHKATPAAFIPRFVNRGDGTKRPYRGGYSLELIGPMPMTYLDPELRALLGKNDVPPGGSFTFVSALGEQWRHKDRFVDLAPRARDTLRRRVPQVHLAWSADERRMVADMKTSCCDVAHAIASPGAELVPYRDPFVLPALFHPAGTCAMATDRSAPCDPRGRLRALPSVWVADASVFPSGGDCHPTLTVVAHALRVAESVDQALGGVVRRDVAR